MLEAEDLVNLEHGLEEKFGGLTGILSNLNRGDQLRQFLDLLGCPELLSANPYYEVHKDGKIVILGGSEIDANVVYAISKQNGISKERLELCLDYNEASKFNFRKMQYNTSCSLIMVGPMPHSGVDKGDYSSIITMLENESGFPPIIRLSNSNSLKITKTSLREGFEKAFAKNYITK